LMFPSSAIVVDAIFIRVLSAMSFRFAFMVCDGFSAFQVFASTT
jgi:DeoR/GlpR family transcriptional regulator of sugar metabolism